MGESQFRRGDIHCGTLHKFVLCDLRVCSHVFSQLQPLGILQSEEEENNVRIKTNKNIVLHGLVVEKMLQKMFAFDQNCQHNKG